MYVWKSKLSRNITDYNLLLLQANWIIIRYSIKLVNGKTHPRLLQNLEEAEKFHHKFTEFIPSLNFQWSSHFVYFKRAICFSTHKEDLSGNTTIF